MFGAAWLDITAAITFGLIGAVSLARLAVVGRRERGENAWQVVITAGMVAMALPAADPLPRWAWESCFAIAAVWCLGVLLRIGPIYGQFGVAIGPSAWRRIAAARLITSRRACSCSWCWQSVIPRLLTLSRYRTKAT